MDSGFEQSEIQSVFNTQQYLSGLAQDKANLLEENLNEQVRKATGISDFTGLTAGIIGGGKALKESVQKANKFYKSLSKVSDTNPSDTKNLIKNELPNETEQSQGIIRKVELPQETSTIESNIQVPDLDRIDLIRRQNLLDRGEPLPDYMKTKQISPEAREQQISEQSERTPFQSDEINDKSAFTRATEDIGKESAEKIGGDVLEETGEKGLLEGLGETAAQFVPGLDILADVGLLGSVIYGGIKEAINHHKVNEKEEAFKNQLNRSLDPQNINPVQSIVAPTQSKTQQGGISSLD
jgi:hypothetical protein